MIDKKRGLIIVLALVLFSSLISAQTDGCYLNINADDSLYCNNILLEDAQAHCDDIGCGNVNDFFIPFSNCLDQDQCTEVRCNLDCEFKSKGRCEAEGGQAVPPEEENVLCTPGCCIFKKEATENVCLAQFVKTECENAGIEQGFPVDFIPGKDQVQCDALCDVPLEESTLSGKITDQENKPISAKVSITGQQPITATNGEYSTTLKPGIYVIKVEATGFLSQSSEVTISQGVASTKDFVLTLVEEGFTIIGKVTSKNGQGLEDAKISYSSLATSGETLTDNKGKYTIEQLPHGIYVVTASKIGFAPNSQDITLSSDEELNFELGLPVTSGITGITKVDFNGDSIGQPFATDIFIDGVFRGKSKFPDGRFIISLELFEDGSEHTIQAFHQNPGTSAVIDGEEFSSPVGYQSVKETFVITTNTITEVPTLLLTSYTGECSLGQPKERKPVQTFTVSPVKGEKKVLLKWTKPCAEVSGYVISKKNLKTGEEDLQWKTYAPSINTDTDIDNLNGQPIDRLDWEVTYEYGIRAIYTDGEPRESETETTAQITLGQEACENRLEAETFCEIEERQKVFSCDEDNNLFVSSDCGTLTEQGKEFFCARVSETKAICKDAAICSTSSSPFGLYSSNLQCYGTNNPQKLDETNYCVYDQSTTPVDQCRSCTSITSCFDYQSKDSCQFNNCISDTCKWIDALSSEKIVNYELLSPLAAKSPFFVGDETGTGYCVEEEYEEDDQCALCGPHATLFENNYCTADVCSNLGRCFSGDQLQFCEECGPVPTASATCYKYESQLECEGSNPVNIDLYGKITPSKDSCSWGSCVWNNGACIKDSDADRQDDCASVLGTQNCKIDNAPPKTTLFPQGLPTISTETPEITFQGDDSQHIHTSQQNPLGEIWYCITSANGADTCTMDKFVSKKYPGANSKETVEVNVLEFPGLGNTPAQGSAYKLKYFSKDIYNNQEDVQETFVFIDNIIPQFSITVDPQTQGDTSSLQITLTDTIEPMHCKFEIKSILPAGEADFTTVSRDQEFKEVIFDNLKGVHYQAIVTCTDDRGNINTKEKDVIFDLQQAIDVIFPPQNGFIGSNKVKFSVNTLVAAQCDLFETTTNTKVATFITNSEQKSHTTSVVTISKPGGNSGPYPGLYQVICTGFLDNKVFDQLLNFDVDQTAPDTTITVSEGNHIAQPTKAGWEEQFISAADVTFSCDFDGLSGLACDKIFFCLGEGCNPADSLDYQEFTAPINVTESTKICYYSTDLDNHKPKILCGNILINGFGITLIRPPPFTFDGEIYGFSGTPQFDWEFTTAVPSTECRFDFNEDFTYEEVQPFKIINNEAGKFLYPNFPGNVISNYSNSGGIKAVFVKCSNAEGQISPEQKFNLEYDPNKPEITKLFAEPDPVVEGIFTILHATTNSKAQCRFSDNSGSIVNTDYSTMIKFEGEDDEVFLEHASQFNININEGKKDFILGVICKNGAGNFTDIENLTFSVDYITRGFISSVFPDGGFFNQESINLEVATSKKAQCTFEFNNQTQEFQAEGNTHTATVTGFTERKYVVPVHCLMQEHVAEDTISFTIDRTGPTLNNISDGVVTCGKDFITVHLGTNEVLQSASVKIFEKGFFSGATQLGTTIDTDGQTPLKIPIKDLKLEKDKKYFVKVTATDASGNVGTEAQSDGFLVSDKDHLTCKQDKSAPDITVKQEEKCSVIHASLECEDETGCDELKYGIHLDSTQCKPTLNYFGAIEFDKKSYICYFVEDNTGKNKTGHYLINYEDDDSDGILDSCDVCSGTTPGSVVDENGCGTGELTPFEESIDTDKDGLPDTWELQYNSEDCQFDHLLEDSDNDGFLDSSNDYDDDGRSNFVEFTQNTDPCFADEEITDKPIIDPITEIISKKPDGANLIAWIFFTLGLLMTLGATGYLVYYYKYMPKSSKPLYTKVTGPAQTPKVIPAWKKRLIKKQQQRAGKIKQRKRKGLFGSFGLPHIGKIIHKKKPTPENLHKLSKKYVEHKDSIGVEHGEKNVFAKLESIAAQKKPSVNKKEAKDIFSKLKKIGQKRKEE